MMNLRNLKEAMEDFRMEDGDADVSIEQTIEIEVAADEETQEAVEVEEAISDSDDVAEETEQMLATLEYAAHAEMVIEEFGYSRPVAAILNRGQDVSAGVRGDLEAFLGITMPANESLDMVSSAYDDNAVAAMEGFKDAMADFWKWIKKQAAKIRDFFVSLYNRIVSFILGGEKAAKRYAQMIKGAKFDSAKMSEKKMKLVKISAFNEADGLIDKAAKVCQSYADDLRRFSISDNTGLKFKVADDLGTVLKGIFGDAVKVDEKGNISGKTSDLKKTFEPKEMTVTESGFNEKTGSDMGPILKIAEAKRAIANMKGSISDLSKLAKAETSAARLDPDNNKEEITAFKKASKEFIKMLSNAQKFFGMVSKFFSHVIRMFVRGQRALLSCKA